MKTIGAQVKGGGNVVVVFEILKKYSLRPLVPL
jgi:hypothetical protein